MQVYNKKNKHNCIQFKRVREERMQTREFIVVRHFFAYVHSPQPSNRSQKSKKVNLNHNPIVKRLEAWLKLQDSGTLTRLGG